MTREEAIKAIKDNYPSSSYSILCEALDMAIQALESIDKIKAEIIEERKGYPPSADYYKAINKTLQIIDKHIGEQE